MLVRQTIVLLPLAFATACGGTTSTGSSTGSGGTSPSSSSTGSGGPSSTSSSTGSGGGASSSGSSSTGGSGGGSLGVSCSGASPSFASDVHPVLMACGGELCHGGLAQGAWPYAQLVGVHVSRDTCDPSALIVAPGSLEGSYLMNKLTGVGMCPGTARMPNLGNPLPMQDIQTIADWICRGAKND